MKKFNIKKRLINLLNKQKTISPGKMHCIKCDKTLSPFSMGISEEEEFYNIEEAMWGDGVVDTFSCGYGSEHDGDVFYFGLCDECITKLKENNKIIFKTNFL